MPVVVVKGASIERNATWSTCSACLLEQAETLGRKVVYI